jgi:hypothetical protein
VEISVVFVRLDLSKILTRPPPRQLWGLDNQVVTLFQAQPIGAIVGTPEQVPGACIVCGMSILIDDCGPD